MSMGFPDVSPSSPTIMVLKTCRRVAERSRLVRIDPEALAGLACRLAGESRTRPAWDPRYHRVDGTIHTVWFLLVLDSLNFCFWPAPGSDRWEIDYRGERLSGYVGLAAALTRAVEEGRLLWQPEFLAALTREGLQGILDGRGDLPLLEERLAVLQETGRVLLEKFRGDPGRLLEAAGRSAAALVGLVTTAFPSFRDTAEYDGHPVYFYKRAQILAADLHGAFAGRSWGAFDDLDQLTAFADYKLPQVLRHLGILHYAPALAEQVDGRQLLPPGSPEEVEIRANTVWAVERIRQELAGRGEIWRAFEIDWLLWNLGQDDAFRKKPYHRTRTIYY